MSSRSAFGHDGAPVEFPAQPASISSVREGPIPTNILAIKFRHIGDNLLAAAALRILKRRYSEASIDYLVPESGGGSDLLRLIPAVDEVIDFPSDYRRRCRLARRVLAKRYDLTVDFSWDTRSAGWGLLTGAAIRLGYYFRKRVPAWPFYTRACPMGKAHTAQANIDLVGLAGARPHDAEDLRLRLDIPDTAMRRAEEVLRDCGIGAGEDIFVLHPASRWAFKMWTDAGNAEFLDMSRRLGLRPVVTCGPSDPERKKLSRILELCRHKPVMIPGRLDLPAFAALLQRAKLFVGVDSAPVHIAAAVGTPVVALFGPSGQKEWYPWQVPHRTIQRLSWSCCPCGQDGCAGTKRSLCLEDIRPEEVFRAAEELIKETKNPMEVM
ncbi:putative lipopolysaccharide heptosyltransferase III [bacterium]|nr:putative lipopolysaccharide heptosyltransferase III [bacterium]